MKEAFWLGVAKVVVLGFLLFFAFGVIEGGPLWCVLGELVTLPFVGLVSNWNDRQWRKTRGW